ncbi:AAA family ATPase [Rhodobacteraceae bacterium B1Z28]|uniref:AAA family ATPase n=1 Tax=Ruegeria haliotis TaxID=2747601 RepID=A0ABX2PVY5_9RHOB|nr:adenylate/guanylate cyclase domain-containing protein [Ruegeria haliotis]NVO57815.1 AAA family ATPase [Ruegeria haliotis]
MGDNTVTTAGRQLDLGQKRQVSVLFADMVGYTAIVADLGEERSLEFVRLVYETLVGAVEEHGGTVRDFAGDSIMALFGIPDALEDPALRACRAAMSINASFAAAADDIQTRFGVRPVMRVGISSGNVLMAAVQGAGSPATAVGSTVNLASRIENLAAPGHTLICDTTRSLVEWVTDLRFFGEHQVKGLSAPQKLWGLQAIHQEATRFDASVAKGLSSYVGRDTELKAMSTALTQARSTLSVIDLVAEPGLGKTRLVFEFLQRISSENTLVMTGYCFADGQQTPYLPILEILRNTFQIRNRDDPAKVAQKLEAGLQMWNLYSPENLGLLLNLLGLTPPAGALDGLDGVLIGLRTRKLLPVLLKARCAHERVILLFEDSHWIDSASEELLRNLVENDGLENLLIIQTRRPEYTPEWLDHVGVTTVALKPLGPDEFAHLAQTRLGVDALPDGLAQQLTERAGGNPLFGEEILSFLQDQGALRVEGGRAYLDTELIETGLPASMRNLLTARIERLQPEDRDLLQAAAIIGRRFDPGLLSQLVDDADSTGAALQRLQAQDVLYREPNSSDYVFKHVLLRDSVCQSLVSSRRAELHLAIADTLEMRNANRLQEAAETLAFHYAQTDRTDQAFRYSAMAGDKSLGVYSLDEANGYFVSALELYQNDPTCATKEQFAAFLASFALCANISLRVKTIIELAGTVRPILEQVGDNPHHALFLHHYVSCLVCNGKYREAHWVQQDLTAMAERLGDAASRVYAMVNELSVSIYFSPIENELFDAKRRVIEAELEKIDDAYIHNFFLATVGWNELTRGRVARAHATSDRMIGVGTSKNDPRSLGYGTAMKALIAMVTDDYELALNMAEEARKASQVEFELAIAEAARIGALVPLKKPDAIATVQRHIHTCDEKGWTLFTMGPATMLGVAYALNGQIADGLRQIENTIQKRTDEGTKVSADWARLFLCEMYLAILTGEGGGSLGVLLGNLRSIVRVMLFGEKELIAMIEKVRQNPQFDDKGHYIARCDMIMGLLYKARKKKLLAIEYLTKARVIVETAGRSPMLTRIDQALTELS